MHSQLELLYGDTCLVHSAAGQGALQAEHRHLKLPPEEAEQERGLAHLTAEQTRLEVTVSHLPGLCCLPAAFSHLLSHSPGVGTEVLCDLCRSSSLECGFLIAHGPCCEESRTAAKQNLCKLRL